uniref:Uncharacterized protein n=1 Tax=Ovis aries TaxID=9940 RepID=A0AC11CXR5_SHEEP
GQRSSSAGWRLLSGTVSFVVTSVETERPKAATAHLPRSWEVRNRYTEEGGRASRSKILRISSLIVSSPQQQHGCGQVHRHIAAVSGIEAQPAVVRS